MRSYLFVSALTIALTVVTPIVSAIVFPEVAVAQSVAEQKKEADRLFAQGIEQERARQFTAALQSFQQSLVIYHAIQDQRGEARGMTNIGVIYMTLKQYKESIIYYEKAKSILQNLKNNSDTSNIMAILTNLGAVYESLEEYKSSINYYEESLLYLENLKEEQYEKIKSLILMKLGNLNYKVAQYEKSVEYFNKVYLILDKLKDYDNQTIVLLDLAAAYESLSEYDKAIPIYEKSLEIIQNLKNRSSKDIDKIEASILLNLDIAYRSIYNSRESIKYIQKSLHLFRKIDDRDGEARALISLGNYYSLDHLTYRNTIIYYEQALQIFQDQKNRDGEATSLLNLGNIYRQLLDYEKANLYYERAYSIYLSISSPNEEAKLLLNMGMINALLLKYDKAIEYHQKALQIFQKVKDIKSESQTLSNLGFLFQRRNQPELAIVFYKQSVNIREKIRQRIHAFPHSLQQSYTESVAGTYRSLANLLIQQRRLPEAQAVLELLKLRELRDFTRDTRAIDSPGISLANIEKNALTEILKSFSTIGNFSQQLSKCERDNCITLNQLEKQRDKLNDVTLGELRTQTALLKKYYATESGTLSPDKLNDEARRIVNAQDGTVLIYPLILKDKIQFLLAFKSNQGGVTFRPFETNITAKTLTTTITQFRNQLENPGDINTLKATSQTLYNALIKPLEPELKAANIKHLVFAPDSTIRYIPLAALHDGKQYLVQRYTISTITAASETNTTEKSPRPIAGQNQLLAMGASTFPNTKFSSLLNVPIELDSITATN